MESDSVVQVNHEIQQLESLCKDLYVTSDSRRRAEAEKFLVTFQNSPDSMTNCRLLLERGLSSYSQLLGATTLVKLVSRPVQKISAMDRLQIKNYVLTYLSTKKLDTFVSRALATLYARIIKCGWFDMEEERFIFRNVIADVNPLLQGDVEHYTIGLHLLSAVTGEMNYCFDTITNRCLAKQRKTTSSFKDELLSDIFGVCHASIKLTLEKLSTINFEDAQQVAFVTELLDLAFNCVSLQFPSNSNQKLLDFSLFQPFFDMYNAFPQFLSEKVLACLGEVLSAIQTFPVETRDNFLNHFMNGIKLILQNPQKLNDENNYHEFCRIVHSIKMNYTVSRLVNLENYSSTIELLAKFTVDSLNEMIIVAPSSIFYLLQFWHSMAHCVPFIKVTKPHLLDIHVPQITEAYITARMESVVTCLNQGEDLLDDPTLTPQEMEAFSIMGRSEYRRTFNLLTQMFDSTFQNFEGLIQRSDFAPKELTQAEGKLTWLVYMSGALIGGRLCWYFGKEQNPMDAELACRVFRLLELTNSRLIQNGGKSKSMEKAYLSFLLTFKKACMGDQFRRCEEVYKKMSEILGLGEEGGVFALFVRKILINLKYWGECYDVMTSTLDALSELSIGNNSNLRRFLKLDEVRFLLHNHTAGHFPLLGLTKESMYTKLRTRLYCSLGRLAMVDAIEDKANFYAFLAPFSATLEIIGQNLSNTETKIFQSEEMIWTVIGTSRDLIGVLSGLSTKVPYLLFFEWIYPKYIPIFERAIQLWHHKPQVAVPVLRLFKELVFTRCDRLQFGENSANSVLLFREISKLLCTYCTGVLSLTDIPEGSEYYMKLKGISICFAILRNAFHAKFVNFGVMRLYGDEALDNALNCFIKFTLSITMKDLMDYPKLATSYYEVLKYIVQDHMNFISSLDPHVFLLILSTISEGIASLDTEISTESSISLDCILDYLFEISTSKNKPQTIGLEVNVNQLKLLQAVEQNPDLLQQMMGSGLHNLLFEDGKNVWAMSRPLLGLILLNEEHYGKLRDEIIRTQPADKQATVASWFESLMCSVERNLTLKNKDKFTLNLIGLRRNS